MSHSRPELAESIKLRLAVEKVGSSQPDSPEISLSACSSEAEAEVNADADTIAGRYKKIREIGRGGVGIVYEVEDIPTGGKFALKVLDTHVATPNAVRRFNQEAELLKSLRHKGIVRAADFGLLDDASPYLLMELVEGDTLSDYLATKGQLSEIEALDIFLPIFEALNFSHIKKIVHRDLKPANVVLVVESENLFDASIRKVQPKVLDFALATYANAERQDLTRTGEIIGTPLYMSPEQIAGRTPTTRSDIYSAACMLFEALAGAPPFVGSTAIGTMLMHSTESPKSVNSFRKASEKVSPELDKLLMQMLSKDPKARPETVADVLKSIAPERYKDVPSAPRKEFLENIKIKLPPLERRSRKESLCLVVSPDADEIVALQRRRAEKKARRGKGGVKFTLSTGGLYVLMLFMVYWQLVFLMSFNSDTLLIRTLPPLKDFHPYRLPVKP